MLKYLAYLGLSIFCVFGCGGGGDSAPGTTSGGSVACGTGNSPYYGCWVTPGCQSIENPISNDPVWGVIRYNFASDGKIYDHVKVYTNSSCTGTPVYDEEAFTDLAFQELNSEMLQSGLTGYRLQVEDVTTAGQASAEVLVTVTANSQLCLSSNLQLTADGYVFVYSSDATDVDLVNNCLDSD